MLSRNTSSSRLAGAAGAWFVLSIASLIINRLRIDIPIHEVIVLGTYWIALWCVGRSVSRTGAVAA